MRLLLVEDDTALGEGLRTGLREEGYTIDWLQDGASALHALTQENFDLVILDLMLPELDGVAVLKKLRDRCAAPVIVVTARTGVPNPLGLFLGLENVRQPTLHAHALAVLTLAG